MNEVVTYVVNHYSHMQINMALLNYTLLKIYYYAVSFIFRALKSIYFPSQGIKISTDKIFFDKSQKV